MIPAHPFVLAVTDIYDHPNFFYHLPTFFKIGLAVAAVHLVVWVTQQFSKANPSAAKPGNSPTPPRPPTRATAPVPAEPPGATAAILVLKDGRQLGPYTPEEINGQLSTGAIVAADLAWHEGLDEWQPVASIAGVVGGHTHNLRPPPPPTTRPTGRRGRRGRTVGEPASPAAGVLIGGYVCAAGALLFFPPVLGLAGVGCGVVAIKRQQVNQGATLLVVSFVCAVIGMVVGAVS